MSSENLFAHLAEGQEAIYVLGPRKGLRGTISRLFYGDSYGALDMHLPSYGEATRTRHAYPRAWEVALISPSGEVGPYGAWPEWMGTAPWAVTPAPATLEVPTILPVTAAEPKKSKGRKPKKSVPESAHELIRLMHKSGVRQNKIAVLADVSPATVSRIVNS